MEYKGSTNRLRDQLFKKCACMEKKIGKNTHKLWHGDLFFLLGHLPNFQP